VCDQDAYAFSGQKCSAQSLLFVHENWAEAGLLERLRELAARRRLEDLTAGPVLTVSTETAMAHVAALLKIPGAQVRAIHCIAAIYAAFWIVVLTVYSRC
jgi:1-pyrroline-5-carboxylate dehydrogenase